MMKLIKGSNNLYHLYIGDKDIWLSELDIIWLERLLKKHLESIIAKL